MRRIPSSQLVSQRLAVTPLYMLLERATETAAGGKVSSDLPLWGSSLDS